MKPNTVACIILILLSIQSCKVAEPKTVSVDLSRGKEPLAVQGISKEEAVAIANRAALKTHESIANSTFVICEQSMFWVVIYDGANFEYLVDRTSGRIIERRNVPQGVGEGKRQEEGGPPKRLEGTSREEAIAIATQDFRKTYGREAEANLSVISCELAKAWRIAFDVKLARKPGEHEPRIPDAHSPTYIVDKKTREVLYRQLY